MKQRHFEHLHQQQWNRLTSQLDRLEKNQDLKKKSVQFPHLYRQVCQHLALARDRHYTPHLVERLNRLVLRGHQHFYQTQTRLLPKIVHFILADFPQKVRQELKLVLLSTFFFLGSLLAIFVTIQIEPDWIYTLMNYGQVRDMEEMYNPQAEHIGRNREAESDFLMFGFYIKNNIGIGFQTFAGGMLFGIGTLFFLIFNGLYIGAVASHLTHIGYTVPFFSFVAGHSGLELTAIILAGAAGLKLGLALIAPGRFTRLQALRDAASQSVILIYGVMGLLLMAAFIEAFWSSNATILPYIKYSVGGFLWASLIFYFAFMGRYRAIGSH